MGYYIEDHGDPALGGGVTKIPVGDVSSGIGAGGAPVSLSVPVSYDPAAQKLNVDLSPTYGPAAPTRYRNGGGAGNTSIDPTAVTALSSDVAGVQLTVPTGYPGNDVVEPTILYDATAPFLGYEYVLCVGAFYQGNEIYENPILWVSHDGNTWVPVVNGTPTPGYAGVVTPIYPNGVQGDGNLTDPGLFRGPDGTYYALWNQFLNASPAGTGTAGNDWSVKIGKATSLAGPWSSPVSVLQTKLATLRPSSPSIFWDGGQWHMYTVDVHSLSVTAVLHHTNPAADPTTGTWTRQADAAVTLPPAFSGRVIWHLNAYLIGTQHVILAQDAPSGVSGGGNSWLFASVDGGVTWSSSPLPWIASTRTYRGCLVVGNGTLDVFYGYNGTTSWQLRRAHMSFVGPTVAQYGGVVGGIPANAQALLAARVPIAPYLYGDQPGRADSATGAGTADSGQAYTAASGIVGISGKQFYAPTAGNNKITVAGTVADGVTSGEVPVVGSAFILCRIADALNFVRFGSSSGSYVVQNIVAGAVAQSMTLITPTVSVVAGDVVALVHNGSNLALYVNGKQIGTATGWTANAAATGVGVQIADTTARVRNVTQRALVSGA